MLNKLKLAILVVAISSFTLQSTFAQEGEGSGGGSHVIYFNFLNVGIGLPQGKLFEPATGSDQTASLGAAYNLDLLYSAPGLSSLRFGYEFSFSGMASAGVDITQTQIIALIVNSAKVMWRPLDGFFSPYITASAGLGSATIPEVSFSQGTGDNVINVNIPKRTGSAVQIGLGAGLDIAGFLIYANYMLPTEYEFDDDAKSKGEIGGIFVSVGYMFDIDF